MLKKKNIVLSDTNDSAKKAVLCLQEDASGVSGTLRLYNFSSEPFGILSLGIYSDKKVTKAGLTRKANMYYEFFADMKTLPTKFSCAVINFQNAIPTPILYGSSEGSDDDIYASIINEISADNSLSNTQNVLDKYGVDYEEAEKEEIEKEIDKSLCCDCANCVYKKQFFEEQSVKAEKIPEENSEKEEKYEEVEPKLLFIDKLRPQIDKLFENNPEENNLQSLIPDSKFVKVEYEDDGDFFVFGLLYDEEQNIKYVCYGVPAVFEEEPPKELSGFPIFLPLDSQKTDGFGYWLCCQDATTGEPIKAILD